MDLAYLAKMPQEEFTARRERVLEQMQDNSALLVLPNRKNAVIVTLNTCLDLIVTFGI